MFARRLSMTWWRILGGLVLGLRLAAAELPTAHEPQQVEGWRVQVDVRLRQEAHAELAQRALTLLRGRLAEVVLVLPPGRVAQLRQVPIWLDLSHGELTSMQYHPSADWLQSHGYARALAKGVHIPVAARFADARHLQTQPWCVLHELAHAYHDQVLGYGEPRLLAAWQQYSDGGRGARVLHVSGRQLRHYAMTNVKEFFAEMTECYFGVNDFFPFVHGELKLAEPELYALLAELWGPSPLTPRP